MGTNTLHELTVSIFRIEVSQVGNVAGYTGRSEWVGGNVLEHWSGQSETGARKVKGL
jgi:hypothetical protein